MPTENGQASVNLAGQIGGSTLFQHSRYFTGKYMASRDFEDEQAYMIGRRRLHNRLLHGWGILDGLQVALHSDPNRAKRTVVVTPGTALDCYGRELLLREAQEFDLPLPIKTEGNEPPPLPAPVPSPFLLCLCYEETPTEFVPALYAEGASGNTAQANRIAESARLTVVRLDAVEPGCWPGAPGADGLPPAPLASPVPAHPAVDCPCGEVVPLALITYEDDPDGTGFTIWLTGRRRIFAPTLPLTRITHINWPHGGELTLADLRAKKGRLEITFDHRLGRTMPRPGTGISRDTFVVQRGGTEGELHFLRYEHDQPPAVDPRDDYKAVFTIEDDLLRENRQNLAGSLIRITLRCDFVLDAYGNPVDGNHLGGQLPTGDGVAGGTFESWFRVAPASDEERARQRHEAIEAQIRQRERRRAAIEEETGERIAERENEINALQEQVEVDQDEKQDARHVRRELRERIEQMESEIRQVRSNAERLLEEREGEIAELRERAGQASGREREALRARITELLENMEELRGDADRRVARLRNEIQELRGAEVEVGGEVAEENEEIQSRRARVAALQGEIETLAEERDRAVERLSEEIRQLKAELEPGKKGGKG